MHKKILLPLCATFLSLTLASCGAQDLTIYRIGYDSMTDIDETTGKVKFDENIFYRNDQKIYGPDPSVIQITDPEDPDYGMFYLYATTGAGFKGYKSTDLTNWEPIGPVLSYQETSKYPSQSVCLQSDCWAPECIYDEDTGLYYFFCSASPDTSYSGMKYIPYVAVGETPRKFEFIQHTDYRWIDGTPLVDHAKENTFLQYSTWDPYKMKRAYEHFGYNSNRDYPTGIDFHPFKDPQTGKKYLFWADGDIFACEMEDWLTPKYETLTHITDQLHKTNDPNSSKPTYENSQINEGPQVLYHKDKNGKGHYYLTLSINGYGDRTYSVIQAVNDGSSPLAPYTKLNEAEGGLLLSTDASLRDDVSGPGHHGFITVNGQLYMIYHKHNDPNVGGGNRHPNVDPVKWLTIKDEKGEDLDVLYVNGPTTSIQPLPEFASGYKNVAPEAEIKATNLVDGSSAKYMTDDFLQINRAANAACYSKYVKASEFKDTTTIELEWQEVQKGVKAVMVYNSIYMENAFYDVDKIEFEVVNSDGTTTLKGIENVPFDWVGATSALDVDVIRPGFSAVAEFNPLDIKKMTLTISPATKEEVPAHGGYDSAITFSELCVNEIKVLSKTSNAE